MKAHSIILLILMTILFGLLPAQVQSTERVPQDTSVDSVAYLLALTRDGVVRVSLNGNTQLIIPGVGGGNGLEVLNDKIYVSNQVRGSSIFVHDLQGQWIRTIPTPPEANRYLDFVVLPDERIALLDNQNDKIFFIDPSGQLLTTTNILDNPDPISQCINGVTADNRLIVAEDGYRNVLQVDLSTFQKSILKDLSSLRNNLCAIAYSSGRYYVSKMGWPNNALYTFTENSDVSLVATIPGENVTGIVVSGDTAYTGLNHAGKIYSVNLNNGSVTILASGLNYPVDLEGVVAPPTYTISGRVIDTQGTPITGVTISDGASHSTITDSGGNYTLTGLTSGSYTVMPSKNGHTFCPRSRSISVPPNQTGQDFSGSSTGTDLGFCSEPNGFGFPNTQLWRTWAMYEQYYGPAAVHNPDGSICTTAQRYFDETYHGVANGWSSVGFTLSSLHSFQSRPQPNAGPFAIAPYSNLYQQPLSSQLTSPIAYYSGVQLSAQYQNEYQGWLATCTTDPNQMVARLQQAIQAGNPLLLSLKAGTVYHAVTPYRVVTVSPTETHIYVYDSEAPGQQRIVRMQRSGSGWQWQYTFVGSLASAGTRTGGCSDMYYYQASASLEQGAPLVDLCADTRSAVLDGVFAPDGTGKLLSVLPAAGNWYLQDNTGRRLGWAGGQWVSEVPGGYELPQTVSDAALSQRLLYLPAGAYTVRADAGASRAVDYSLFADGRVLQVDGQTAAAGVTSVIGVSPGLDAISVTQPDQFTSLAVDLVRELPTASRVAGLSGSAISGNADLAITFDGQALELSRASGTMSYRLRFFQPGTSTGYFASEVLTLEPDQGHRLTPATWNGLSTGTVLLEIDEGRDGTVDEMVTLTNQARSLYLPIVLSIR